MYLKLHEDGFATATEISDYFQLSQNHIVKVISNLGKLGLIETIRGKGGGVRIRSSADQEKLGHLVRSLEPERDLVQCVNKEGQHCAVAHACKLTKILDDAIASFYGHLDQFTLEDILNKDSELANSEKNIIEIIRLPR